MSDLIPSSGPFEAIRRTDVSGAEYWSARDLMPLLGYDRWENFAQSLTRAFFAACNSEGSAAGQQHFRDATKMVPTGSGAERAVGDRHLTRYACYLVAMNGDPRKPEIAAPSQVRVTVQGLAYLHKRMGGTAPLDVRTEDGAA